MSPLDPSRRSQEIVARQLSVDVQPNRPAKMQDLHKHTHTGAAAHMVLVLCWLAMPSSARARADDNALERSRVDPAGVCQPTRSTRSNSHFGWERGLCKGATD